MKVVSKIISRDEALSISPDYVRFIEKMEKWAEVNAAFSKLKKGQPVLTFLDGKFRICNVSSVRNDDFRAVDGPVVRVTDGEYSWRVDGCHFAFPVP